MHSPTHAARRHAEAEVRNRNSLLTYKIVEKILPIFSQTKKKLMKDVVMIKLDGTCLGTESRSGGGEGSEQASKGDKERERERSERGREGGRKESGGMGGIGGD